MDRLLCVIVFFDTYEWTVRCPGRPVCVRWRGGRGPSPAVWVRPCHHPQHQPAHQLFYRSVCMSRSQGADPPPSMRGKAGRNYWNEEITPLLPTGIGEQFSQTICIKFNTCSALAPMWTPPINESAELTRGALVNSVLWVRGAEPFPLDTLNYCSS